MHVTRVELENIKSYEKGDFHFERGTTAITGENGAGKTTILEAIAWALFDTLDYSKEDFLRRGAKRGVVRVTFESDIDERQYVVYRDTGTGYYVYDPALGVRIAERKGDVSAILRKLLGIEPGTDLKSLFRSAIGVPQGTFTAEFLLPANARKAAFDRLLKVEEYREGADRLKDTVNLLRDRIADTRERIAGAEGQLARYDEQVAEHSAVTNQINDLRTQLESLKTQIESSAEALTEADKAEARVRDTRLKLERLSVEHDAALKRLEHSAKERDAALAAVDRLKSLEPDYLLHISALDSISSLETQRVERDRLNAERSRLDSLIAAALGDIRRLEDSVDRAVQAEEDLEAIVAQIQSQIDLEKERERLRDLRAHAMTERARLAKLDIELENLRKQHAEIKSRAREAEKGAGALEEAERLESLRLGVETQLSRLEKAATSIGHLRSQKAAEIREIDRLKKEVARHESDIREIERQAGHILDSTQLISRERELTEQLAKLRAEIDRDERFHAEVKNGLCPILSERCLNIGEGQTLEDYFKVSLASNSEQLSVLEKERTSVSAAVSRAREVEKQLARVDNAHRQLAVEREQLSLHEAELARVETELKNLPDASTAKLNGLKREMFGLDAELKVARENALKYAELQPLLARLQEIESEGRRRRDERETVAAAAAAVETLDLDIKGVEERLEELKDPRGRANVLKIEADSLQARKLKLAGAQDATKTLEQRRAALLSELERFAALDAEWDAATATRDRTAASHREYVANQAIGSTLEFREAEFNRISQEASLLDVDMQTAGKDHESALRGYDPDQHASLRVKLAALREQSAADSARLQAASTRAELLEADIKRLDEVRASMREQFLAKERLEQIRETTEFIRDTLKTAGPIVTESYIFNISMEANLLFREISGEAGRTLKWSRDYEILLEEEGYERSFPNLSGGEQMAAALAVRLAILKQLSDIRLAFFDEPTVNMDAERRERLAQQIGHIQHFDQLFVISHDDTFEESADHILHIVRRGNETVATEAA